MDATLKFISMSLALLSFLHGASGQCTISDIKITQSTTGASIHGKPEYEVVISNNCICSQSSLVVSCHLFQSVVSIDSNVFRREGGNCSVNNGQPVFEDSPIKFMYAWDHEFNLQPVSSQINCS